MPKCDGVIESCPNEAVHQEVDETGACPTVFFCEECKKENDKLLELLFSDNEIPPEMEKWFADCPNLNFN